MIVFGLLIGFACLGLTLHAHGGHWQTFLSLPALLIVVGGSLAATLVAFRGEQLQAFWGALRRGRKLRSRRESAIVRLARYAGIARHQGLLRLEKEMGGETEPLVRDGMDLIVSGVPQDALKAALHRRISAELDRLDVGERFCEALGGYAPTFGIIGTVMGLVSVLSVLNQPGQLAQGVSSAFVATFYGIVFANAVFLPLAARLREHGREYQQFLEVIGSGLLAVQAGEAPRSLADCLSDGSKPNTARRGTLRTATQEGKSAVALA